MFVNITTTWAGARRIARVNRAELHASELRLVGDKRPQLVEGPTQPCRPLRLANSCPVVDTREVFNSNSTTGAFSLDDKVFANFMVGVAGETCFLSRQFLQSTFRRLSTYTLKFRAEAAVSMADVVHRFGRVNLPVTVSANVNDAHVHAEETGHVSRLHVLNVTRGEQVERTVSVHKVGLTLLRLKEFALSFSARERHLQPARCSPDRDDGLGEVPREYAGVIGDGPEGFERPLRVPVKFVSVCNLLNGLYSHLCSKVKSCLQFIVAEFLEVELPELTVCPGYVGYVITGCVGGFERMLQSLRLFIRGNEFNLCGKFHVMLDSSHNEGFHKSKESGRQFLPTA